MLHRSYAIRVRLIKDAISGGRVGQLPGRKGLAPATRAPSGRIEGWAALARSDWAICLSLLHSPDTFGSTFGSVTPHLWVWVLGFFDGEPLGFFGPLGLG